MGAIYFALYVHNRTRRGGVQRYGWHHDTLVGYRGKLKARHVSSLLSSQDIAQSQQETDYERPSHAMVRDIQEKHISDIPEISCTGSDGCCYSDYRVWIPNSANDLELKILILAHCDHSGRRAADRTLCSVSEKFVWSTMKDDCSEFFKGCIHPIAAKGGNRIPRPLSITVHTTKPNQILHFDYLYMGPGCNGYKYVLVLRDDLSSYIWLCPTIAAESSSAAAEIARWI